jgi:hypothetical protein
MHGTNTAPPGRRAVALTLTLALIPTLLLTPTRRWHQTSWEAEVTICIYAYGVRWWHLLEGMRLVREDGVRRQRELVGQEEQVELRGGRA